MRAAPALPAREPAGGRLSGRPLRGLEPQGDNLSSFRSAASGRWREGGARRCRRAAPLAVEGPDRPQVMNRLDDLPDVTAALPREVALGVREGVAHDLMCGGLRRRWGAERWPRRWLRLPVGRDDVERGPGDDCRPCLRHRPVARQVVTVVPPAPAVTEDPVLRTRISRGSLPLGGMSGQWAPDPQAALASLILAADVGGASGAHAGGRSWRRHGEVFGAEGAGIVGVAQLHGAEIDLGFTVRACWRALR